MLSQLVYVSTRKSNCTPEEIDNILATCLKDNPPLGITGILLYTDDKFIQLLEGKPKVIMSLYEKIKTDDRHKNCMLISYTPILAKSFPSWHMATKQIGAAEINYASEITAQEKTLFDDILLGNEVDGTRVLNLLKKFFD